MQQCTNFTHSKIYGRSKQTAGKKMVFYLTYVIMSMMTINTEYDESHLTSLLKWYVCLFFRENVRFLTEWKIGACGGTDTCGISCGIYITRGYYRSLAAVREIWARSWSNTCGPLQGWIGRARCLTGYA